MTKWKWYEANITQTQGYVLLDNDGNIRASAYDIPGIVLAKEHFGWGKIHKFTFDGKILKIGKEIK